MKGNSLDKIFWKTLNRWNKSTIQQKYIMCIKETSRNIKNVKIFYL